MYVTLVYVHVKDSFITKFISATEANHLASIKEPGNVRFDIIQLEDDPARFVLYEAYRSKDHAAEHKETIHYAQWRDTVADWMASPRNGVVYQGLFPKVQA